MQSGSSVRGTRRQRMNKFCHYLTGRSPARSQGVILPKAVVSDKEPPPVIVVVKRRRWVVPSGKAKVQ